MQRLEVSGAVRPIYGSLGVKRLTVYLNSAAVIDLLAAAVLGDRIKGTRYIGR